VKILTDLLLRADNQIRQGHSNLDRLLQLALEHNLDIPYTATIRQALGHTRAARQHTATLRRLLDHRTTPAEP